MFCSAKGAAKRMERQATDREKMFRKDIADEGY